ncbi:MAG: hypothetical protein AAGG07_03860 [Planctomycetota bacterium]
MTGQDTQFAPGGGGRHAFVPPPPVGPGIWTRAARERRGGATPAPAPRPTETAGDDFRAAFAARDAKETSRPFDAELDVAEIDERYRPGSTWAARAQEISRSHVIVASRRMCYEERLVVIAVHLIDAKPVPLFGVVRSCDYDGDGLYRVEIELLPMPEERPLLDWIEARSR